MTGSASCSACPMFSASSAGSTTLEDCDCNVGYMSPAGAQCEACAVGRFGPQDPGRKAVCSDCPAGTSSGSAAIKLADCTCIRGFSGESDGTGSRFSALSLGARSLALSISRALSLSLALHLPLSCALSCSHTRTRTRTHTRTEKQALTHLHTYTHTIIHTY